MVKPYKDKATGKKEQVADMFNKIAHKYDFLNHFLSGGIDYIWRKRTIATLIPYAPKKILDIATGTGDLAIAALKLHPEKVIGIDISAGMLAFGKEKIARKNLTKVIELLEGDSEAIGFRDGSFDAITVAFGIRNFGSLETGLKEMYRVLKPGGVCAILEFSRPARAPFRQIYGFYFRRILPWFGKVLSKDQGAYNYLPESVLAFPDGKEFITILSSCGFVQCKQKRLTFGIATIYNGEKPMT
jgi:demethylmenaquinone methyltransferase / 2-methoxy-6-polyprenyl-1,4-benzoquinol methylase